MNLPLPSLYDQLMSVTRGSIGPALLLTLLLGVVHAVSPGHGKTLVVASLLGSQGSLSQVLLLAVTVAVTHTAGVLLLAVVVTAGNPLLPQEITPYIALGAALLVVVFGVDLTRRAVRARRPPEEAADEHGHDHPHLHPGPQLTRGYTLSIGVVGGLVPNGTALIVLVMAIAFREVALGVLLVATFGLGIAATLASIGVAAVLVRQRGGRFVEGGGALRRAMDVLPMASGLVVVVVGLALTFQSLSSL